MPYLKFLIKDVICVFDCQRASQKFSYFQMKLELSKCLRQTVIFLKLYFELLILLY